LLTVGASAFFFVAADAGMLTASASTAAIANAPMRITSSFFVNAPPNYVDQRPLGKSSPETATNAEGPVMTAAAVVLGLAIPALIFAFMRLGAALWFDVQNRGA
jgi:hypothetical protein